MVKSVAIQGVGYLVLLALLYAWFGIADRNALQLVLSVVLGLAIAIGAVWLIASALSASALVKPGRLGSYLIWIVAGAAVIGVCAWLAGYRPAVGLRVASQLTQWFRKPVKPQTIGSIYAWLIWIVGAAVVLAILPLAAKAKPTRRYWITAALALFAGVLLPSLLVGWVPKFESFSAQTVSMVVRFTLAYAIALAAWLAIAASARGSRNVTTA